MHQDVQEGPEGQKNLVSQEDHVDQVDLYHLWGQSNQEILDFQVVLGIPLVLGGQECQFLCS